MQARVLLVDDDADLLELLRLALEGAGHEVITASSGAEAIRVLEGAASFDVIVSDYQMGDVDGAGLARWALDNRGLPTIVLTGKGTMDVAIEALRAGAFDFHRKPTEPAVLDHAVQRAARYRRLEVELQELREQPPAQRSRRLIGESRAMQRIADRIRRVAPADVSVLVTGETGTGKEVVARALHEASPRRERPFVAINCAAIPENLLESELFGNVKGAFTGAQDRTGLFVAADGGTLFLDEIGEMPASMQAKLLRALQEQKVRPVGGTKEVEFDVRLVAATNRDLEEQVEEGSFREDLYYRLDVVQVNLPPLRSRGTDVLLLAKVFVEAASKRLDREVLGLAESAAQALIRYDWPGNVRELQAAMQHAVALTQTDHVVEADLPDKIRAAPPTVAPESITSPEELPTLEHVERQHVARVLGACEGNKARTARVLGLDRRTLYRKLERFGIEGTE